MVYDEYGPVRMIRTKEWKYVHRYPYGKNELYDLKEDPQEENNLYGQERYEEVILDLRNVWKDGLPVMQMQIWTA